MAGVMWARLCDNTYTISRSSAAMPAANARCASAVKWQPSAPSSCTAAFASNRRRSARASAATSAVHGANCAIASCEIRHRVLCRRAAAPAWRVRSAWRAKACAPQKAASRDYAPCRRAASRSFFSGHSCRANRKPPPCPLLPKTNIPYGATASSPLAV